MFLISITVVLLPAIILVAGLYIARPEIFDNMIQADNYAKILDHKELVDKLRMDLARIAGRSLRNSIIEHERTPGEVAVMCAWLKGMGEGAHPLSCPASVNDSTYRLNSQYSASGGRIGGFPAK
jgi:hypothetical protein